MNVESLYGWMDGGCAKKITLQIMMWVNVTEPHSRKLPFHMSPCHWFRSLVVVGNCGEPRFDECYAMLTFTGWPLYLLEPSLQKLRHTDREMDTRTAEQIHWNLWGFLRNFPPIQEVHCLNGNKFDARRTRRSRKRPTMTHNLDLIGFKLLVGRRKAPKVVQHLAKLLSSDSFRKANYCVRARSYFNLIHHQESIQISSTASEAC